ncbi:CBO0543 family protein [Robertmurraya sp. GLU-23]
MNEEQSKSLENLKSSSSKLAHDWVDYWKEYSSFDTWQFWLNIAFLIIPLIVLYFKLDRSKAFHIGFFGYSAHILSTYIDGYSTRFGHWEYPYKIIPLLPINMGLDTSLIPVVIMLVYQWTLNRKKNYYIAVLVVAALFAFVFKPILSYFDLFQLSKGSTYFHLFLWYISGGILSKWVTNIFFHFEKSSK